MIAPVASEGVTLSPGSTTNMSLVGRLVPQDSDAGLAAVSTVFNNFIHGNDSDVVVHGASAGPSDVWATCIYLITETQRPLGDLAQRGYQESCHCNSPSEPRRAQHHQVHLSQRVGADVHPRNDLQPFDK